MMTAKERAMMTTFAKLEQELSEPLNNTTRENTMFHVCVLMKATYDTESRWECTGEGPWDSQLDAEDFARAEVGGQWCIMTNVDDCDFCDVNND